MPHKIHTYIYKISKLVLSKLQDTKNFSLTMATPLTHLLVHRHKTELNPKNQAKFMPLLLLAICIASASCRHDKYNQTTYTMQTEKSQPVSKQIMLETRFTEFQALSVDPRVGISLSALKYLYRPIFEEYTPIFDYLSYL